RGAQLRRWLRARVDAARASRARRVRRQIHDRLPGRVSSELVSASEALARAPRSGAELLRRKRVAAVVSLAQKWLDLSRRSARLVSVVLSLLHGPAKPRRRTTDPSLATDAPSHRADQIGVRAA